MSNASIVNNYIVKTQMKHGISSWSVPFAKETIYTMDYPGLTLSNLMEKSIGLQEDNTINDFYKLFADNLHFAFGICIYQQPAMALLTKRH